MARASTIFFTEKYLIEFKNFQKFIFALQATDIIICLQKPTNKIHKTKHER